MKIYAPYFECYFAAWRNLAWWTIQVYASKETGMNCNLYHCVMLWSCGHIIQLHASLIPLMLTYVVFIILLPWPPLTDSDPAFPESDNRSIKKLLIKITEPYSLLTWLLKTLDAIARTHFSVAAECHPWGGRICKDSNPALCAKRQTWHKSANSTHDLDTSR